MKWLRTHPDADVLSGYANRTLDEGDQRSSAEHLESCEPCRDSVMILRRLMVSEGGALPPRVLDKVLEGRTTGRRVILPVGHAARSRREASPPPCCSFCSPIRSLPANARACCASTRRGPSSAQR